MSLSGHYQCIKLFNARLGDELSLSIGDKIEALADDSEYNDGWYMGRNVDNGKVGLFPKLFTKQITEENPEPTLLRSRSRRVQSGYNPGSRKTSNNVTTSNETSLESNPKQPADVNSTMSEIDKALEELQLSQKNQNTAVQKTHQRTVSAQSLTEDLNPLKAYEWTAKQVSSYFAIVLGFDLDIAGQFARHKITGEILFQLDLGHLKELDIDSFGTRFELYKEIEKLRQVANRAKNPYSKHDPAQKAQRPLSPESKPSDTHSPPFNNSDEEFRRRQSLFTDEPHTPADTSTFSGASSLLPPPAVGNPHLDGSSQSLRQASSKKPQGHARNHSQSMENLPTQNALSRENSFMSPRRAPAPPPLSPINKNFKFGGGSPASPQAHDHVSPNTLYMTRTNASSGMINSHGVSSSSRPPSSVYDHNDLHLHAAAGSANAIHKRHSSLFSFMSANGNDGQDQNKEKFIHNNVLRSPSSPTKGTKADKRASRLYDKTPDLTKFNDNTDDIDDVGLSPKREKAAKTEDKKNPQGRLKSLRSVSTQNFKNLTGSKKLKTSAFQEGIRDITPDEAIKTSSFSGWMSKKSGSTLGWRSRYFTLHGTRLSYFTSLRDKRERGLIDITAHKVVPISTDGDGNNNDKYVALYAALTGLGRYCFKIVPPAPGFKKGLTFTQPKTHYFAVESQDEMRGWLKALMTATIDIDDNVPVVSSCNTPTVSLSKAQEMLARAREESKLKDEDLRARGIVRDGDTFDETSHYNESGTSDEMSPVVGYTDDTTLTSNNTNGALPKLTIDTHVKGLRTPSTPQVSHNSSGGFASPYLLASGLLSPRPIQDRSPSNGLDEGKRDYFADITPPNKQEPIFERENSASSSRSASGSKKKEKLMAYTSDGSFVIKSKK